MDIETSMLRYIYARNVGNLRKCSMKQYLNSDQTAKLIELGFEKPTEKYSYTEEEVNEEWYSIGELIEILNNQGIEIKDFGYWIVDHEWHTSTKDELIDALYDTIINLKEKGKL